MKALLGKGANPNQGGGVQDRPIHLACSKGFVSTVKLLLDSGADRKNVQCLRDIEGLKQ